MSRCYGTTGLWEADCGSARPHGEHPLPTGAEQACPGASAGVTADCGHLGPHGEHPMSQVPR